MSAEIYDALSQGNAFNNPLPAASASSQGLITNGQQSITGLANIGDEDVLGAIIAGGLSADRMNTTKTMYSGAGTGITTLNNYGDQSVREAYSRIGTSVSYKSGLKGIGREPDNCDLINKAFGIVQETGKQWLSNIEDALSPITSKIEELYALAQQGVAAGLAKIRALAAEVNSMIDSAVSQVNQTIQDITDGITEELNHIAGMVRECLNFSFANVLGEWAKDLCAGGVINSIGSDSIKNAVK